MPFEDLQPSPAGEQARKKYRKGMKDLGRGLIALSILQILIALLFFAMVGKDPILVAVMATLLGVLAVVNILLGIFALQIQVWVNYAVIVWASLLLLLNFLGYILQGMQAAEGRGTGGGNAGGCCGIVILVALIYYSVRNLQEYGRMKAANLEP
jgi:hypothetical protein